MKVPCNVNWYQLTWILIAAVLIAVVYVMER